MREEHDAVWAETTDGGLLRQLFGQYPTLHDATILRIAIDRAEDRVTMEVDYNEFDEERNEEGVVARIRLEWHGIRSFDFPLGDTDLLSLDLARQGSRIVTTLETWPGVFGTVVSDRFEAILTRVDPPPPDERTWLRYD